VINYNPIQKLKLDIEFIGIKESNNYLFDKASNLSKGDITQVLSDFFDDPKFEHLIYQFNSLEFDLGTIPYKDFETIFIERFKIQLSKKFKEIFENNKNDDSYNLKNNESNILELIKFYLLNGRLPWWSNKLGVNSISNVINEFLNTNPNEFRSLLLEIGKNENVRKRIAYTFSEDLIKLVIKVLSPAEFEYIFVYHDYILKLNNENRLIIETESSVSKAVWYNIISYLLTEQSSVFEKKEFLKRNLYSISAFYNIEYQKLLSLIYYATIYITPTFNSEIYKFAKDIQNIYLETNYDNQNDIFKIENFNPLNKNNNRSQFQKNIFNDEVVDGLYILNYYINYGSLPEGFQHFNINDLKNIFNNIFLKDQLILEKFLLNISFNTGFANRIFNILNTTNYKFAIDIIIKPALYYSINDIHKSFIQLLISQNRTTSIYLSDEWKIKLLNLVYLHKFSINYAKIFNIYLRKYADENQVNIFTAVEIYYKDLLIQNNQHLINKLIEVKNEIIDEYNIISIDNEIQTDKGLIDLIKFIIDNGFVPWWGSQFVKNDFEFTIEKYFQENPSDIIYLLTYANKNPKVKIRFINLIGEDKFYNLLYGFIQNDENIHIYKTLEQYLILGNNSVEHKRGFIIILWETLIEYNFSLFTPNYLIQKYILYINNISKKPVYNIIDDLLTNTLIDKNQINNEKLWTILNDLKIFYSEKNYYQIKSNEFEKILKNNYKTDNINKNEFENYLNYISTSNFNLQHLHINNAESILNNILYREILPNNFNIYGNVNIDSLILRIFEYLYINERNKLKVVFNNHNQISGIYKFLITDWIFTNTTNEIAVYISDLLFSDVQDDVSYLETDQYINSSIFYNQNIFDSQFIEASHKILEIDSSISKTIILDKYQEALNTYLQSGNLNANVEDIDNLLKYLIISIYQQKGSKILLDIFNNNPDSIFRKHLLSFFENANNIQERQIYNSIIRSTKITQSVNTNLLYNSETDKAKDIQDEIFTNATLFNLVKQFLNVNNLSNDQYIETLINYLKEFLEFNAKPSFLLYFNQNNFEYYFKLLINDIVKKSPSDLYNLLIKYNNPQNILYIFQLYNHASYGIELTIKNTMIDFFKNHTLHILKEKLKKNIEFNDSQYNNITNEEFKKIINDLLNNNKFYDLQYILDAKSAIKYFDFKIWLNKYLKVHNNFDKKILELYFNLIIKSFENTSDKEEINYLINKTFIIPLINEDKFNDNNQILDNFITEILNYTNNKSDKLLYPIIEYFENLTISQPHQLIVLIDQTILKSKTILKSQKLQNSDQKNDKLIKDQVKIIKDTYEKDIKLQQDAILQNQQLNQNNDLEDVLKNESIFINNIGLILFHLFIPTYFNRLNLLNAEGNFLNIDCQYRAVHLLQLLVSDATYDEHELVLNKILCNLEIDEIIPMEIQFTDEEKALSLELIGVVIQRWEKMSNSSIGHFRAAFLMRDGRLKLKTDGWYLNVEKRGYDIILSTIPWAFGVIKFKWMHKFLYTEWT
jgi:hypothetical protein